MGVAVRAVAAGCAFGWNYYLKALNKRNILI